MPKTLRPIIDRLADVVQIVSLQECEATKHGQEPCPVQYDDDEEWCLVCLAKKAYQAYVNES